MTVYIVTAYGEQRVYKTKESALESMALFNGMRGNHATLTTGKFWSH